MISNLGKQPVKNATITTYFNDTMDILYPYYIKTLHTYVLRPKAYKFSHFASLIHFE